MRSELSGTFLRALREGRAALVDEHSPVGGDHPREDFDALFLDAAGELGFGDPTACDQDRAESLIVAGLLLLEGGPELIDVDVAESNQHPAETETHVAGGDEAELSLVEVECCLVALGGD
jgi:hypothetical protein